MSPELLAAIAEGIGLLIAVTGFMLKIGAQNERISALSKWREEADVKFERLFGFALDIAVIKERLAAQGHDLKAVETSIKAIEKFVIAEHRRKDV